MVLFSTYRRAHPPSVVAATPPIVDGVARFGRPASRRRASRAAASSSSSRRFNFTRRSRTLLCTRAPPTRAALNVNVLALMTDAVCRDDARGGARRATGCWWRAIASRPMRVRHGISRARNTRSRRLRSKNAKTRRHTDREPSRSRSRDRARRGLFRRRARDSR